MEQAHLIGVTECDCGNDCAPGNEACDRCSELDGNCNTGEYDMIRAFRLLRGEATKEALVLESGLAIRTVERYLAEWERAGKLIRYAECDGEVATYVFIA